MADKGVYVALLVEGKPLLEALLRFCQRFRRVVEDSQLFFARETPEKQANDLLFMARQGIIGLERGERTVEERVGQGKEGVPICTGGIGMFRVAFELEKQRQGLVLWLVCRELFDLLLADHDALAIIGDVLSLLPIGFGDLLHVLQLPLERLHFS